MDCAVASADFHVVVEFVTAELEGHMIRMAFDNYCIQAVVDTMMVAVADNMVTVDDMFAAAVDYDDMQRGVDFAEAANVVDYIDVEAVVYLAVV